MKKIIIFTFSSRKIILSGKLFDIGVNLDSVLILSDKENLGDILRETRPKIILVDGELPNDLFLDCIDIAEKSISDFDMDTKLCVFERDRKTPGTIFITGLIDLKNIV
ncbi:MAG: hypothetical protein NT161_03665 [Candidatus Nomurabacteria bacterium]|nr:hypothetical protein [Candidatus Nomurabacteria bacterium]